LLPAAANQLWKRAFEEEASVIPSWICWIAGSLEDDGGGVSRPFPSPLPRPHPFPLAQRGTQSVN